MIYLYGLTDATDAEQFEGLQGVTGAVVTAKLDGALLVYGEHDGSEIRAKRRAMLAHARVLETVLLRGTVLPMRFGMVAEDVAEVDALVAAQREKVEDHFARLNGLIELGLRVNFDRQEALEYQLDLHPEFSSQREILARSSQQNHMAHAEFGRQLGEALDRHRTDCQKAMVGTLKPHVRDLVLRTPESEAQVLAADILLPEAEQETFATVVDTLARQSDFLPDAEPQIRLVGPVPPYNFVQFDLGRISSSTATVAA